MLSGRFPGSGGKASHLGMAGDQLRSSGQEDPEMGMAITYICLRIPMDEGVSRHSHEVKVSWRQLEQLTLFRFLR